ncbi:MAG TPA: hypothetical protein ENJ54_06535 [Chloroflexi bacterium]|nr:hypothetical protein [Chloroflexota bacterium]
MENKAVSKTPDNNTLLLAGVGGAAFIVGLLIGLVVLGWWLWPVKWINAAPQHLSPEYQREYLQMAIEAYAFTGDAQAAKARFDALGEKGPALLEEMAKKPPKAINIYTISSFADVVGVKLTGLPAEVQPPQQPTAETSPQTTPQAGGGQAGTPTALNQLQLTLTPPPLETPARKSATFRLVAFLCGIGLFALILAALLFYFFSLRRGKAPKAPITAAQRAQAMTQSTQGTDFEAEGKEAPLSQFMTTYVHGDDLFDDSFSIDSPTGEFLGECGVGITETIGVGEPKRVMAFEIWIFDKNDIQTVTKVLMSEHAYNDEAIRERLAAKGEPVLARPGEEIVLETAKLQMRARVVDMAYGNDALPANSYFDRLTLELAVWPKEG